MAESSQTPKPSNVPMRLTLSQVIAALSLLNVNVESPAEQMDREEQEAQSSSVLPTIENVDGAERATLADGRPIPVFSGMMIASPWTATSSNTTTGALVSPPAIATNAQTLAAAVAATASQTLAPAVVAAATQTPAPTVVAAQMPAPATVAPTAPVAAASSSTQTMAPATGAPSGDGAPGGDDGGSGNAGTTINEWCWSFKS
ncbi:hypothetical protein BDN70DRAFT_902024 [Pholiota conissans]|uniref:Uncharacterized protein n=1 Tax=Pholiota conissans TaxID=109636 RepID=A0A9P5YIJ4_9AGAR|nr:hypothetical protein BDN70DRAFT_902024 [Pholiota conissans]